MNPVVLSMFPVPFAPSGTTSLSGCAELRSVFTRVTIVRAAVNFEFPANTLGWARCGDVIGMTGANEATMMRDRGIRYASLCIVDNYANGVADAHIDLDTFRSCVAKNEARVERILHKLLSR